MIQEAQEADYLIISPENKKDIILDQLKDLQLYNPDDSKNNLVHQFFFEDTKFDPESFLTCKGSSRFLIKRRLCAIAIKVPIDM